MTRHLVVLAVALSLAACATPGGDTVSASKPAPLFTGLGNTTHVITTSNELVQRYFDQGLALAFAFNHAEAERSFRYAAELDPSCAMCWWGVAFVLGPNINARMEPTAQQPAWEAVQRAQALRAQASPKERAYIDAIAKRYGPPPVADRAPLDRAFAEAMRELVRAYPGDLEATSAYAEALMNLNPWDYYDRKGRPKRSETLEIVTTLETVLKRDPGHPWAIHLYIHATEASSRPERALPYAETLHLLVPMAGHLVHMPAHTYMRVGRYHDAVLANERAVAADDSYLEQCHSQGVYAIGYVPHNHHFMWAAASMAGMSVKALHSAHTTDQRTAHEMMREPGLGGLQHFSLQPLYAMVRFGAWDKVLAAAKPADDLLYPTAFWHYARGRALAARDDMAAAEEQLALLAQLAADPRLKDVTTFDINSSVDLLAIAAKVLGGEIAAKRKKWKEAIGLLEQAVKLEDALNYNEPPDWNYPVRHSLGAVLLEAGRASAAEAVYQEDLKRNPDNGWALFGLMQAHAAQGRKSRAAETQRRFERAWEHADVQLVASRF